MTLIPSNEILYGDIDAQTNRFKVSGDARRMYQIGAAGGLYSIEWPPHRILSGSLFSLYTLSEQVNVFSKVDVLGSRNMISNGTALYGFGKPGNADSIIRAARLGVNGTSGGLLTVNETCEIITSQDLSVTNSAVNGLPLYRTVMLSGEAVYQNTDASVGQYGAVSEQFANLIGGTVTIAAGSTSLTGNGTTFTTANLGPGGASIYTYTPSLTKLQNTDLILLFFDNGNRAFHRIVSVNAATGAGALTIYPAAPSAATAKGYILYRTGYLSFSRVLEVVNRQANPPDTFDSYNYYVGNSSFVGGGTIQCFVYRSSSAASHFMCPQNSAALDISATDIAYYKGFLLYGSGSSISWSVTGFPTSFATGFGTTDFPAGNISVIDITDTFIGFEYLGEQLIAIFNRSLWQVQATGTVPEFNFYKLAEPIGATLYGIAALGGAYSTAPTPRNINFYNRPMCSGRNSIFYWGDQGLMQLSGSTATNVSRQVFSKLMSTFSSDSSNGNPAIEWEPTTDSVIVRANSGAGFMYNIQTATWSYLDLDAILAPSGGTVNGITGSGQSQTPQLDIILYDKTNTLIKWIDTTIGGPFSPGGSTSVVPWTWATPVIGTGDEYGFQLGGFQLDGIFDAGIGTSWFLYGGRSPYQMHQITSGTINSLNDRMLFGRKLDFPFICIVFQSSNPAQIRPMITGVNIYPVGMGK